LKPPASRVAADDARQGAAGGLVLAAALLAGAELADVDGTEVAVGPELGAAGEEPAGEEAIGVPEPPAADSAPPPHPATRTTTPVRPSKRIRMLRRRRYRLGGCVPLIR
jgi:hypothetical protein